MRLSEFIVREKERISQEWESFAQTLKPGQLALRDHIGPILDAIAADIETTQSETQRSDKSRGLSDHSGAGHLAASQLHAIERAQQRFSIDQLLAEFRALRASILRLWSKHFAGQLDFRDIEQITRFNEAIDQALAESVTRFSREVQDSRDLFLAILSHDLRSPLSAITSFTEVLRRTQNISQEQMHVVAERIKGSADRITKMVNGLLDVARTRFGNSLPIDRAPMALDQLCEEIVKEAMATRSGVNIQLRTSGNLSGNWDRVRLSQLVANLIGNAIEHGEATKPITVTVGEEGADVIIAVHNEGPPIPEELRPSVFKPFVRAADSRAKPKVSEGLGLGLYIACQIVTAHGGTIDFESSEDTGTTFTARFPRVQG